MPAITIFLPNKYLEDFETTYFTVGEETFLLIEHLNDPEDSRAFRLLSKQRSGILLTPVAMSELPHANTKENTL